MGTQADQKASGTRYLPWLIWGTLAGFYFYQFLLRVSPSVISVELMRTLQIQAYALGELVSYYYIGYTAMQIPVGLLIDRVGVRTPLLCALSLCMAGCYLFATQDSYAALSFARFLMGVGSAFAFLSCVKVASIWFKPAQLSMLVGMTMLLGTAGGALGGVSMSYMLQILSWREVFVLFLGIGLMLMGISWCCVRDRPQVSAAPISLSILQALRLILSQKQTYIVGLYGGLMYIPLSAFADMWGTPYLMEAYSVPKEAASSVISMMYFGIGLGAPLTAWFAERVRSYRRVMLGGAFAGASLMGVCLYITVPFSLLYPLYFCFGLALGAQFLAYTSVCQMNPLEISGTVSAVQNMCAMISGIVFQPLVGHLLEAVWEGGVAQGAPRYTPDNFVFALTLVPACLLASAVLAFCMRETFTHTPPQTL